jgi:hypothetical protein
MKIQRTIVAVAALATLAGCNRTAGNNGAAASDSAAPAPAANTAAAPANANITAAASTREAQEIHCGMGRCTYLRVEAVDTVNETNGERLLRVRTSEGSHQMRDGAEQPASPRDATITWSPQPSNYHVLCSTRRPTLIVQKEGGAGLEAYELDMSAINFASIDLYAHYAAACHPGEKIDIDTFATRHNYQKIEGDQYDLARPEDVLNRRS